MFGRQLCSRLSLVRPSLQQTVQEKQPNQKVVKDESVKYHEFSEGGKVLVKMNEKDKWKSGKVIQKSGPLYVCVELSSRLDYSLPCQPSEKKTVF